MYTRNFLRFRLLKPSHPPSIPQPRSTLRPYTILLVNQSTRSPTTKYQHPPRFLRIQSGSTGITSLVILTTGLVAASFCLYNSLGSDPASNPKILSAATSGLKPSAKMASKALPGRPGNLTTDQEAKLQEMWTATLSVFGVPVLDEGIDDDTTSTTETENPNQARARAVESDKKKKKRMNMFGRKHQDNTVRDDVNGPCVMDGDDKYGQAKEYQKLLDTQSPEDLRKAFWSMVKHDDPDGLLLRFLRARKWNVKNALIMLVAAMHWRMQEMHVDDDIIRRGEGGSLEDSASSNAATKKEGEDFLAQMRLGKSFLHGTDREGRPMCFVRVRLHKQGEQTESSVERYTVYTIETARYLLSSNVDTAVSYWLANEDDDPNVYPSASCLT